MNMLDLTMLEAGCSSRPQRLKKHFKHFHDEKIYQEIATVCHLLGTNGNTVYVKHVIIMLNPV